MIKFPTLAVAIASCGLLCSDPPAQTSTPTAARTGAGTAVNRSLIATLKDDSLELVRRRTPAAVVVAKARDAVAHVIVWVTRGGTSFRIERPSSGVLIDPSGLLITPWDLVREAFQANGKPTEGYALKVRLHGGTERPARLLARDEATDLALLQVDAEGTPLPAVELADSDATLPGEPAVVLSFPEGEDDMVFAGVVTPALAGTTLHGRSIDRRSIVLTDAAIQRESHGGALLDATGRLLGLCNATHVARPAQEPTLEELLAPSFGFAIGATAIRKAFPGPFSASGVSNTTLRAPRKATAEELAVRRGLTAAAVEEVADSIVAVYAGDGPRPSADPMDPYGTRRREGVGSGVIVDTTGLVLTNAHIVGTRRKVSVTLRNGKTYSADVLRTQPAANAALLKIDLPVGARVEPARLGDDGQLRPGEWVVGVGNPFGDALSVSVGVLSAVRQPRLQVDPTLGNHNGGGALVDVTGRVIGLVDGGRIDKIEAAFRREGDDAKIESSLSFALGINAMRQAFRGELDEHAGSNDSVAQAPPYTPAEEARRRNLVSQVVEETAESHVNVYVSWSSKQSDQEENPFLETKPTIRTQGLGSGVIITDDGLAITNWHVVDGATERDGSMRPDHAVHVRLRSGKQYETTVLSISRIDDLALLRLHLAPGEKVQPIRFGSSEALREGDMAIAIGNPHGLANTATAGVITAKEQAINIKRRWSKFRGLLQTDAAINGGNSGGALLDAAGRLIGINSAGGSGRNTTGFAIPVDYVREKLHKVLTDSRKMRSIYTGLQLADTDAGVVVTGVHRHGPAGRAGIVADDVIVSLDGEPVAWSIGLAVGLVGRTAERPLVFEVLRGGTLEKREVMPWTAAAWDFFQQADLLAETITFRTETELVRSAAITAHRRFVGDPTAEPLMTPQSLVRIVALRPGYEKKDQAVDVRVGDLLVGMELVSESAGSQARSLHNFGSVEDVRDSVQTYGAYDGSVFRVWLYRDSAIVVVDLPVKKLLD